LVEIGKRSIDNIGRKFITLPLSGRILKKGDKHNGLFFVGIVKNKTTQKENWCTPDAWFHLNIREARRAALNRSIKKGIEFNVSVDYLKDIFPKDSLCPIFNCEMTFCNTDKSNSASLDRKDSDVGYIEGNVQWICTKANTLKSNAHPYELMRLANYTVKQLKEIQNGSK
jgi:hypothetical protein